MKGMFGISLLIQQEAENIEKSTDTLLEYIHSLKKE
jgi:hypothetical protein